MDITLLAVNRKGRGSEQYSFEFKTYEEFLSAYTNFCNGITFTKWYLEVDVNDEGKNRSLYDSVKDFLVSEDIW
jgi:hypothetical protein